MSGKYVLDGKTPVPVSDVIEWGTWFESADRHVSQTKIGGVTVSTVFLGLDHSFGSDPPVLFETMVFGGLLDEEMARYETWDQAVAGHDAMVERVKSIRGEV